MMYDVLGAAIADYLLDMIEICPFTVTYVADTPDGPKEFIERASIVLSNPRGYYHA